MSAAHEPSNAVEFMLEYDERDRVIEHRIKGATPEDDIVTQYVYDAAGNLAKMRDPNCVESGLPDCFSLKFAYEGGVNWLKEVEDSLGNREVRSYDLAGNVTRVGLFDGPDEEAFTIFKYDAYNRVEYVYFIDPEVDPTTTAFYRYEYDLNGNLETVTDPEGHETSYTYTAANGLYTVTQTAGSDDMVTTYGRDRAGNIDLVIDPKEHETRYKYSDAGWVIEVDSPDSGLREYTYDPAGNLTVTNPLYS